MTDSTIAPTPTSRSRIHLGYLDGLRGLAALYVVLGHTYGRVMFTKHDAPAPIWFSHITNWLGYAHYAVAVFIVLSGYCLMIPIARTSDWHLRGGLGGFFYRRSRRILPPYFAALFFAILFVYIGTRISAEQGQKLLGSLTPGSIVSHLLVLHNLHPVWSKTIDPPMWSVGTEWDIYFLFALVLLPVMRRWGIFASVIVAFLLGLLPLYTLPASYNLNWACPWYLGLFALGMLGAVINFSERYARVPWNTASFWAVSALLLTALFVGMTLYFPRVALGGLIAFHPEWIPDVLVGLTAMSLICYCTAAIQHRGDLPKMALSVQLLGSKPLVFIGTISYSLYLVHQPLIEGIYQILRRLHLSRIGAFLLFFVLIVPIVIAISYLFHLAFERRFMNANTSAQATQQS